MRRYISVDVSPTCDTHTRGSARCLAHSRHSTHATCGCHYGNNRCLRILGSAEDNSEKQATQKHHYSHPLIPAAIEFLSSALGHISIQIILVRKESDEKERPERGSGRPKNLLIATKLGPESRAPVHTSAPALSLCWVGSLALPEQQSWERLSGQVRRTQWWLECDFSWHLW